MKIFVLESLKKDDPKTGKAVSEYLDTIGVPNEFVPFRTPGDLYKALEEIESECTRESIEPFIHIDCHGNNIGIAAYDTNDNYKLVTWPMLSGKFRNIYVSSGKKSIICMSSCMGFNVAKMVAFNEPCPYHFVCGSFEKISFSDSLKGYKEFYDLVAGGMNVKEAAALVNKKPGLEKFKFIGLTSAALFQLAINGYIETISEESLLAKKEEDKKVIEQAQQRPLDKIQSDYLDKAYSLEGQAIILNSYIHTFES
jgi:hypothetical protein